MLTRPDNGVYPSTVIASDIDNAEIAARLGMVRLRRSGRVIFCDPFTSGINWSFVGAIANVRTLYNGRTPYTPPGFAMLRGASGVDAFIGTNIPIIGNSLMGIEVTFALDDEYLPNVMDYFTINLETGSYEFSIRWNTVAGRWEYYSALGTWIAIPNVAAPVINTSAWLNLKMVVDIQNGYYRKFYYNRDYYNFNLAARVLASAVGGSLLILVNDTNATPAGIFIDNVIVTSDEPE